MWVTRLVTVRLLSQHEPDYRREARFAFTGVNDFKQGNGFKDGGQSEEWPLGDQRSPATLCPRGA